VAKINKGAIFHSDQNHKSVSGSTSNLPSCYVKVNDIRYLFVGYCGEIKLTANYISIRSRA